MKTNNDPPDQSISIQYVPLITMTTWWKNKCNSLELTIQDAILISFIIKDFVQTIFKSRLYNLNKRATLAFINDILQYKIGEGAEAIVIDNSFFSIAKITQFGRQEVNRRNSIPNAEPLKFIGYVKNGNDRFPTYKQKKVRILNDSLFEKHINSLDKAMKRKRFFPINDSKIQYRAYTNGEVVIDDISPDNIGLDLFNRVRIIDFNLIPINEYKEQGFNVVVNNL